MGGKICAAPRQPAGPLAGKICIGDSECKERSWGGCSGQYTRKVALRAQHRQRGSPVTQRAPAPCQLSHPGAILPSHMLEVCKGLPWNLGDHKSPFEQ
eukprot:3789725-Rhodomonas_salina.1